jgi:hypothetical protein
VRRWPIFKQPYQLESDLPPDEVARRLTDNLASGLGGAFVWLSGTRKRQGRVWGDRFWMRARPGIHNTSTFQFEGRIEHLGTGSRLVGQVGPSGSTPVFLLIWFGMLSFFEVFFIIFALDPHSTTPPFPPQMVLFPLGMGAFGVVVVVVTIAVAKITWRATELWLMKLVSGRKPGNPRA